jgi:NAD(P)H dehydrogenase (quinone)
MAVKVQVVFYSTYGHVYRLAEGIAEGARQVPGADVQLFQVPELLTDTILDKMGAAQAKKTFAHVPVADPKRLAEADCIFFGTPTRFGNVTASMQNFFDATGGLWVSGALIGKVGSVFTSTATQHGGQETTIRALQTELFHHGMVVVGCPYAAQELMNMNEITGGSPYGAGTLAGPKGDRQPSENELKIARFQGRHVAQIAAKLAAK